MSRPHGSIAERRRATGRPSGADVPRSRGDRVSRPGDELTTLWHRPRQAVAAVALLTATITAVAAVVLGDARTAPTVGVLHVATTVLAIARPVAIRAQVAAGVALAATLLVGADGTAIGVVPVVSGVVATAELLGLAGQMRIVIPRDLRPGLGRVGFTTAAAVAVSTVTLAAGQLGGPAGTLATAFVVGGCLGFAALLRGTADPRGGSAEPRRRGDA